MKKIENSECLADFGRFVKSRREALNLYQEDVANGAGISQVYYSQIERGVRCPTFVTALKVCQVLNLNMNDFIKQYL